MLPIFQRPKSLFFFFFNDTATTEIYTLSLHDALPISIPRARLPDVANGCDRIHDATRQCLWRPLGRTQEVGLPYSRKLEAVLRYGSPDRPDYRRLQARGRREERLGR